LKNAEIREPRLFAANLAKKAVKKASARNLYKRRIKAVFAKHKGLFGQVDVLIMPRPGIAGLLTFAEIEENLLRLFPKRDK